MQEVPVEATSRLACDVGLHVRKPTQEDWVAAARNWRAVVDEDCGSGGEDIKVVVVVSGDSEAAGEPEGR
jgi:hypothetical protein